MKKLLAITASAVVLMGATAVLTGPASAKTFKLGLTAPFTGPFAVWGKQFQQSVEAFQAANGDSVNGNKVEIVYRDAGGPNPAKSKQLAEELVLREKVDMLVGYAFTPNAMAVGKVATQSKTPVIIMNAATGRITRGSEYYVRVSMTLPQMVSPMGPWAVKHGIKSAYVLVSDYAPGHDAEVFFAKNFEKAGGKIVGGARMPLSTTDFSVYVEKALQAKPDALYMFMPAGAPSIAFVNTYAERGLKKAGIKLLGSGETQELFLPNFSDDVNGTFTSFHYTETNNRPQNKALWAALRKTAGPKAVPDIATLAARDGMTLIYRALKKLGPDAKGMDYVNFMKGQKLESARGPIVIDPDEREVIQNIYIREVRKVNGKLVNVDIETIPMVKDPWKLENPK